MNIIECIHAELYGATEDMFAYVRSCLCHPSISGDELGSEEVFEDSASTILQTPIECGRHAYIYNGYVMLGAVSDNKVYVQTNMLKTPARARAINEYVLDECDFKIDPDTWLLKSKDMSYTLVNADGFLVGDDGVTFTDGNNSRVCNEKWYLSELAQRRKQFKFYAEFCINTILDLGGYPQAAYDVIADNPAFLYSPATPFHGGFSEHAAQEFSQTVEMLSFMPNIVDSALSLLHGIQGQGTQDLPDKLAGKMVWDVKKNITELALSIVDYPTTFGRS